MNFRIIHSSDWKHTFNWLDKSIIQKNQPFQLENDTRKKSARRLHGPAHAKISRSSNEKIPNFHLSTLIRFENVAYRVDGRKQWSDEKWRESDAYASSTWPVSDVFWPKTSARKIRRCARSVRNANSCCFRKKRRFCSDCCVMLLMFAKISIMSFEECKLYNFQVIKECRHPLSYD